MKPTKNTQNSASIAFWLIPVIVVVAIIALRATLTSPQFESLVMGESGLIELGTVIALLPGIAILIRLLSKPGLTPLQRGWFVICVVGWVYFGGEELSWGQHLFGWSTPEQMAQLNDQQETNLHNISSWLDQKPRLLLELGLLIGSIIVLIGAGQRSWFGSLIPRPAWAAPALAAILVKIPERISDLSGTTMPYIFNFRLSEWQELMFAIALSLYAYSMLQQCRHGWNS